MYRLYWGIKSDNDKTHNKSIQSRARRRAKRAIRQIRHTALRDEFGDRCRLNAAAAGGAPGSRAGQMASSTGSICPL